MAYFSTSARCSLETRIHTDGTGKPLVFIASESCNGSLIMEIAEAEALLISLAATVEEAKAGHARVEALVADGLRLEQEAGDEPLSAEDEQAIDAAYERYVSVPSNLER